MTESKTIKNPSPLVLAVLALDAHFADLTGLSERIEAIDLRSNFDFEQSEKLIALFAQTGDAVSKDIVHFVSVLNETRARAESAAEKVSQRADQIRLRKDDIQEKMGRFQVLSDKVVELNQSLLQFKISPDGELSDEAKEELKGRLAEVGGKLNSLIEEAKVLKEIGYESKIKSLEQNADAMRQSLTAVEKKIHGLFPLH